MIKDSLAPAYSFLEDLCVIFFDASAPMQRRSVSAQKRRGPFAALKRAMSRREGSPANHSVSSGSRLVPSTSFFWKPRKPKAVVQSEGSMDKLTASLHINDAEIGCSHGASTTSTTPPCSQNYSENFCSDDEDDGYDDYEHAPHKPRSMLFQLVFQDEFEDDNANNDPSFYDVNTKHAIPSFSQVAVHEATLPLSPTRMPRPQPDDGRRGPLGLISSDEEDAPSRVSTDPYSPPSISPRPASRRFSRSASKSMVVPSFNQPSFAERRSAALDDELLAKSAPPREVLPPAGHYNPGSVASSELERMLGQPNDAEHGSAVGVGDVMITAHSSNDQSTQLIHPSAREYIPTQRDVESNQQHWNWRLYKNKNENREDFHALIDQITAESEDDTSSSAIGCTRGLKVGGGAPAEGTRQRIRARHRDVTVVEEERDDDATDDLYRPDAAWGTLVSNSEVQHFRRTVWKPNGDCPEPHTVGMGYHAAWDIGKRGTIAMKQNRDWEFINPCRLRMFLMHGTEPYSFLTYYSRDKLQAEFNKQTELNKHIEDEEEPLMKGVICAAQVRDAEWFYKEGKLRLQRPRDSKRKGVITITRLPTHFMDAMIVCIREMEVFKAVTRLTWQRVEQVRTRRSSARCAEDDDIAATIGATRRMARALVAHSPDALQNVLQKKKHEESEEKK